MLKFRQARLPGLLICALLTAQNPLFAAGPGDANASVKIGHVVVERSLFSAKGNLDKKLAVCNECHGVNGAGDADFGPDAAFGTPAMRGLTADYMVRQLAAYRNGMRSHHEMTPMSALLSEEDGIALSNLYSKLPVPAPLQRPESKKFSQTLIREGESIALKGVKGDASTACVVCHQPKGVGLAPAFPRLAGQNAVYIENQMNAWRNAVRKDPAGVVMVSIAQKLSPGQIKAVSAYYESLLPR
jgi:cytochrome c553